MITTKTDVKNAVLNKKKKKSRKKPRHYVD